MKRICRKCGYKWVARVLKPRRCPNLKCQSPDWDKKKVKKKVKR